MCVCSLGSAKCQFCPASAPRFWAFQGRAGKFGGRQGWCFTWPGRAAYFPSLPILISSIFISNSSIIMIINIIVIARKSSGSFDGRGWQHRDLLIWLSSSLIAFWCSTPYFLWPKIWDFILQMMTVMMMMVMKIWWWWYIYNGEVLSVCLSVTKNHHFLLGVSCNHLNHP